MIEEICVNLADIPDIVWAKYAYDREPLNGRISFDSYYKDYYLIAKQEGKKVAEDYKGKDVNELAKELGAKITFKQMQPTEQIYNFAMFTEPDDIVIYKENADESQEIIESVDDKRYKDVKIKDIILAHELFHMLQVKYPDLFIFKPHIHLWKIFKWENNSKIVSLEEVAAMSFAENLLKLKVNPYAFDVVMTMSRAPERSKRLYNYLMEQKEVLQNG